MILMEDGSQESNMSFSYPRLWVWFEKCREKKLLEFLGERVLSGWVVESCWSLFLVATDKKKRKVKFVYRRWRMNEAE